MRKLHEPTHPHKWERRNELGGGEGEELTVLENLALICSDSSSLSTFKFWLDNWQLYICLLVLPGHFGWNRGHIPQLHSALGRRIPIVSILSGCCLISKFGRHPGMADHSPRFHAKPLNLAGKVWSRGLARFGLNVMGRHVEKLQFNFWFCLRSVKYINS